jgi:hypothetical protein
VIKFLFLLLFFGNTYADMEPYKDLDQQCEEGITKKYGGIFNMKINAGHFCASGQMSDSYYEERADAICKKFNGTLSDPKSIEYTNDRLHKFSCKLNPSQKKEKDVKDKESELKLQELENKKRVEKIREFKKTCSDIGYKEGSDKFNKCVMKLLE